MAEKFLKDTGGLHEEVEVITESAGATDGGKLVGLAPVTGKRNQSTMSAGIGPDTVVLPATEALGAGKLVNVYDDGGEFKCRLADATTVGKEATHFTLAAVSSGAAATLYPPGNNNDQMTGLTPFMRFLSTTPGEVTSIPSSALGNIVQIVGTPTSATNMMFNPQKPTEANPDNLMLQW